MSPEHPRPHTKGASAIPPLRCQTSGAEVLRAPRVLANQTSVTQDSCPHSDRAGRTATGRLYPSQGAGREQGARDPARQPRPTGCNSPEDTEEPDRLELLDAAISAHPARRRSLSRGAHAAAAALARPLAASAAPSPWQSPGDAQKAPASGLCLHFLLHQMTRCCRRYLCVVSVPLVAFARFSPGVGG